MNFIPNTEERKTLPSPAFIIKENEDKPLDISFQLYIELHSLLDAEACMNSNAHKTIAYLRNIINKMNVVNAFEPLI